MSLRLDSNPVSVRGHLPVLFLVMVAIGLTTFVRTPDAIADDPAFPVDESTTTLGGIESSAGLTTQIVRTTSGNPSALDQTQISHLAAHVIVQAADARHALENQQADKAIQAVRKAASLTGLLRAMLPTTRVRTTVRDADGKTVYQDERSVQDERIAVMDSMVRMEIADPVREAMLLSEDDTNAETSMVHTRMFLNLGYVERRLAEAERQLKDEPRTADKTLRLLLARGVEFESIAAHRPLADARDALWSAQWAASNEQFDEAKAQLQAAEAALDVYGQQLSSAEREKANKLREEVQALRNVVGSDGKPVVPRIREALGKVRRWFDLHKPLHYDEDGTETNQTDDADNGDNGRE